LKNQFEEENFLLSDSILFHAHDEYQFLIFFVNPEMFEEWNEIHLNILEENIEYDRWCMIVNAYWKLNQEDN
jgi:hypothetical protein